MRFSFYFMALVLASAAVQLVGCAATPARSTAGTTTACEGPRPQVCTMIYAPVCAEHNDGSRQTHASACNACADDTVLGHEAGACDEEAAP